MQERDPFEVPERDPAAVQEHAPFEVEDPFGVLGNRRRSTLEGTIHGEQKKAFSKPSESQ